MSYQFCERLNSTTTSLSVLLSVCLLSVLGFIFQFFVYSLRKCGLSHTVWKALNIHGSGSLKNYQFWFLNLESRTKILSGML